MTEAPSRRDTGACYFSFWLSSDNGVRSGERPVGSVSRREIGKMDGLWSPNMWGSPVGLGILIFLTGIGTGVFLWGLSKVAGKKQ